MAIPPISERDHECAVSLSAAGTIALSNYRNTSENSYCRLVATELGYGLLALAATVETAFRAAITLVLAALFVVTAPFAGIWLNNYGEDVLDPDKNTMLLLPLFAGFTTVLGGNEVLVNLVALIQNPRLSDEELVETDCTFKALFNCCPPDKMVEKKAEEKSGLETKEPLPEPDLSTEKTG